MAHVRTLQEEIKPCGGTPDTPSLARQQAPTDRRTTIHVGNGRTTLLVPAAGLWSREGLRSGLLVAAAVLALVFGFSGGREALGAFPATIIALAGFVLMCAAAFTLLKAMLSRTDVQLDPDGISIKEHFPPTRRCIWRSEARAVLLGEPSLVQDGYYCGDWCMGDLAVVVLAAETSYSFGSGLAVAELRWLRTLLARHLEVEDSEIACEPVDGLDPPERFWSTITRSAAYALVVCVVLLMGVIVAGAPGVVTGSVAVFALFLGTLAFLAYRSFRLERAACGWHRAVMESQAAQMGLEFEPKPPQSFYQLLPEFEFFRGPRRIHNVAWNKDEPRRMMLFDFTSGNCKIMRDAVGCAMKVEGLSGDIVSLRPRLAWQPQTLFGGDWLHDGSPLARTYRVEAEDQRRARALLQGPVEHALVSGWSGQGPAPWVCLRDGMVAFSIQRRLAEQDKGMQHFIAYARKVRDAISARLEELRQGN